MGVLGANLVGNLPVRGFGATGAMRLCADPVAVEVGECDEPAAREHGTGECLTTLGTLPTAEIVR
jgi:hypothetical protein